ncbi:AI-2E family transporter [Patescibacteria group bacterium]
MNLTDKKINIEISTKSIIKLLIVLFLIWLLYLIRDVVVILFFAVLLVSILEPIVFTITRKKVPKILAVILIYLVLIAIVGLIIVLLIPPIADQVNQLSASFPHYWQKMTDEFLDLNKFFQQYGISQSIESTLKNWQFQLPESTGGIFSKVGGFVSGIFSVFVIMVITFYFLVEQNATKKLLRSLLPSRSLPYAYQLVNRIQQKLGLWLRAQLVLGLIIFALVYICLFSLGVKYALILAIIAGLLEFIPYLGPIISGFIAVVLTLFQSPIKALLVLIIYILIQAAENHIFVPQIMRRAVGLNPVISIFALLIGGKLGGVVGIIIAIPLATALSVIVEDFFSKKKAQETKLEE